MKQQHFWWLKFENEYNTTINSIIRSKRYAVTYIRVFNLKNYTLIQYVLDDCLIECWEN